MLSMQGEEQGLDADRIAKLPKTNVSSLFRKLCVYRKR